jgi:hypothetical protein
MDILMHFLMCRGAATGNWAPKAVIPLRDKPKGIIP